MKKLHEIEKMNSQERRNFLKFLGLVLASPLIPIDIRFKCHEIAMSEAYAQSFEASGPTNFIEINLRDQFDIQQGIVAPSLAKYGDSMRRGLYNNIALFDAPSTLLNAGNNFYLAQEGRILQPHLDTIAVIETCELSLGNLAHGHEAANCTRSPGRGYNGGSGRGRMCTADQQFSNAIPNGNFEGNEDHYSAVPTPAVLHNYLQRKSTAGLRKGIIYKGLGTSKHTVYHYTANLQDAELDRMVSTSDLLARFANLTSQESLLSKNKDVLTRLLKLVDSRFLASLKYNSTAGAAHTAQINGVSDQLKSQSTPLNLTLSADERQRWGADVPNDRFDSFGGSIANLWEQCAYVSKLMAAGVIRTAALEFRHGDIHNSSDDPGGRSERFMRAQGKQALYPLARLIQDLKNSGIYDRTVIAMYTTDGGRTPAADSWGDVGKNTVILAGGRIKGGYYGDVKIAADNGGSYTFSYHKPDDVTGIAVASGVTDNSRRTSGASVWKTVAKATGIPASLYNSYADVQAAPELNYLLRA